MSTPVRRRQVSYRWRLRELMAERGLFTTVELVSRGGVKWSV